MTSLRWPSLHLGVQEWYRVCKNQTAATSGSLAEWPGTKASISLFEWEALTGCWAHVANPCPLERATTKERQLRAAQGFPSKQIWETETCRGFPRELRNMLPCPQPAAPPCLLSHFPPALHLPSFLPHFRRRSLTPTDLSQPEWGACSPAHPVVPPSGVALQHAGLSESSLMPLVDHWECLESKGHICVHVPVPHRHSRKRTELKAEAPLPQLWL